MNQVELVGNVGRINHDNGKPDKEAFIAFSIATNEVLRSADGAESTVTTWHSVSSFGITASRLRKQLKVGAYMLIVGQLKYDEWEDSNKSKHLSAFVQLKRFIVSTEVK